MKPRAATGLTGSWRLAVSLVLFAVVMTVVGMMVVGAFALLFVMPAAD